MGNKVSGKVISEIKKSMHRIQKAKVVQLSDFIMPKDVKTVDEIIKMGYDPVHAAYISAQNILSYFCEKVSSLPALEEFCQLGELATQEYMPSGPPWSPLTTSYFSCWLYFDVTFGSDRETIATCLIDVFETLMPFPLKKIEFMLDVIDTMQASRMGIYEHCGMKGDYVILKELVSEREEVCLVPVRYSGEEGQLWLVRILPSLYGDTHHPVVFTTPYIIESPGKNEWLGYFQEVLPKFGLSNNNSALNWLMKYGLTRFYWPQYIFSSFCGNIREAIFLKGLPKSTLKVQAF